MQPFRVKIVFLKTDGRIISMNGKTFSLSQDFEFTGDMTALA